MRDLVVLMAMMVLVPLALRSTFIAYLLWGWAGLIALPTYVFSYMGRVPYVQVFALLALTLVLLRQDKQQIAFKLNRTLVTFLIFGIHALFVASFAYDGLPRNWEIFSDMTKTILYCMLMPMVVATRLRIHSLIIVIVLALSFHGLLEGLKFLVSAGGYNSRGVPKFGDNNYFAMAMGTLVPLQLYLVQYSKNKWVRRGFAGVLVLTVLAVISTNSRGGLLTLFALALWVILNTKRKAAGVATLIFCGALVVALAPASWSERMNTMKSAEDDTSFMSRVAVWKKSTAIALEHPVLGGGFYAVQSPPTFDKFRSAQGLMGFLTTPDPGAFAAHSIYFQVMGDMGFVGFFIYMFILANAFYTRVEIKRLTKVLGSSAEWAANLSDMLAASLIAFMVGGALLSAAYLEIPFLIFCLLEVTKQNLLRATKAVSSASKVVAD